jgi:hypothetical protein
VALARLNDKISRLKISGGVTSDLGSVNAGALISVYVTNERVVTGPGSVY